ncbi:chitin deacetylase 8 [Danaus plexippus]|uniref:Chitin deacetylase 1 n=1 Tax=Danaus plexippus plexippus TaxID=278856 RepID=A0A212F1F8_DANPL|nr:chitin deacetylase 8 [Danaus plexippus]OWR47572.1 chitin deacetylase 1 [Danaus plexippus plexippus]
MRCTSVLLGLVLFVSVHCQNDSLPAAEKCDPEKCKLPNCRCSSTEIPGNLEARDTPQFVILTFDDAVTTVNIETYRSILYNRANSNRCPIGVTFFINHEYTDYSIVNELYNRGFEIALHSITHKTNQTYWKEATVEESTREFVDQRILVSHFANIPQRSIQGIRSPFLQLSGNSTYQMIKENGLTYDLSWPTVRFTDPGLWPYTLDYASIQDCVIAPCPTASVPGVWVIPMISWTDLEGFPCSFVDACFSNPNLSDEDAWFQYIVKAFEKHYLGNRSPFGFYVHEWFVRINPGVKGALVRFMNMVQNMNDAFLVNANEVVNWVKNPVPLNEFVKQDCPRFVPAACRRTTCSALKEEESGNTYYMTICNRCPRVYPWLNNPRGV